MERKSILSGFISQQTRDAVSRHLIRSDLRHAEVNREAPSPSTPSTMIMMIINHEHVVFMIHHQYIAATVCEYWGIRMDNAAVSEACRKVKGGVSRPPRTTQDNY